MATLESGTGEGLSRFLTAVTFVSRVGALNAGLMGVFNWNLVDAVLGRDSSFSSDPISHTAYLLAGLVGVITLFALAARPGQRSSTSSHGHESLSPVAQVTQAASFGGHAARAAFVTATGSWVSPRDSRVATGEHALS